MEIITIPWDFEQKVPIERNNFDLTFDACLHEPMKPRLREGD